MQADDPDLPAFYFDPIINPVSAFRVASKAVDDADADPADEEDFYVSDSFEAIFENEALYNDNTAAGINLYWAPRPVTL